MTLDGLQREAKAQRDLLEGYLQRYSEAFSRTESDSALPDVRVVSRRRAVGDPGIAQDRAGPDGCRHRFARHARSASSSSPN